MRTYNLFINALTEAKTVGLRSPAMEEKAKDYIERNK